MVYEPETFLAAYEPVFGQSQTECLTVKRRLSLRMVLAACEPVRL